MEDKLKLAQEIFNSSTTPDEKKICELAIQMVKNIHLDDECILSCYLYYSYIKSYIYIPLPEKEQRILDENARKQEEDRRKKIDSLRLEYKNSIKEKFGEGVLNFLHALKKLLEIDYKNEQEEAENIRKMFFALAKDVRVILVKICFVLAEIKFLNTEAIESVKRALKENTGNGQQDSETLLEKTKQKSKQILELFAPLAARLGLSSIKSELEDISFGVLHPEEYEDIYQEVQIKYQEREKTVESLKTEIKKYLTELGLSGEVMGRKKHIYSIYKKLQEKGDIDKIYDLVAVRAILTDVADCYALLGKINENFLPLQHRFKDYIAIPKSNGYKSLHTTVLFEGVPVEIQIRTQDMHRQAEFGVAAHWMYKEKRAKLDSLDERLGWIREIMENENEMSSEEIINSLKVDIYDGEIFVQTPKGKVLHMPEQATPIDFAYLIHSDIGNKCVGAKVNGKMQPITTPLENGDIVEIVTNPNSKGPSRDWLKVIKTPQARSKIMSFFRKEMKEENIKNGKIMLEQAIKNLGYAVSKITEKKYIQIVTERYNFNTFEELLASIGYGAYSAKVVAGKFVNVYLADMKKQQEKRQVIPSEVSENYNPNDKQVNIKGVNNLMIKFAHCCCPMHGDEIIGFISRGNGIIVHRKQCPNISFFEPDRLIDVEWQ